jgi:PKD repeat protein
MKQSFLVRSVALALVAVAAACTMKKQEEPEFAGPSEFATSISISVTPDVITQDGASQSVVTVSARGPNNEVLTNVPLRAEILVNGIASDFGTLSARNLVTGADGRATLVYTAPNGTSGLTVDQFTVVDIGVTPIGSNFGNTTTRFASLRLMPRGTVVVPANLQPAFTVSNAAPGEGESVLFDATTSTSPNNNPIAQYLWDFGDGASGSGPIVSHAFTRSGTFTVTLTLVDTLGRTAQTARTVSVLASANPTANFVSSPAAPAPNTAVTFNASASTAASGRRIVSYAWDFGDPNNRTAAEGVQTTHVYTAPGTYTVTLTVTDDRGRVGTASRTVTVL